MAANDNRGAVEVTALEKEALETMAFALCYEACPEAAETNWYTNADVYMNSARAVLSALRTVECDIARIRYQGRAKWKFELADVRHVMSTQELEAQWRANIAARKASSVSETDTPSVTPTPSPSPHTD